MPGMSDERLAEIKARADKATPGPWQVGRVTNIGLAVSAANLDLCIQVEKGWVAEPDAEFIAAARQGVPELLAEVERLRARVAELAEDSALLNALRAAGVDNWDGYGHAHDILREWQGGGEDQ